MAAQNVDITRVEELKRVNQVTPYPAGQGRRGEVAHQRTGRFVSLKFQTSISVFLLDNYLGRARRRAGLLTPFPLRLRHLDRSAGRQAVLTYQSPRQVRVGKLRRQRELGRPDCGLRGVVRRYDEIVEVVMPIVRVDTYAAWVDAVPFWHELACFCVPEIRVSAMV